MCGIYGYLSRDGSVDGASLAAMDRALYHRGPDDNGTLLDAPCALGMRRLSIIDLDGGHQPMTSEDRSVWVVFNGEIYNHRALRESLVARGHRVQSESDTEVIVHLYEDLGDAFVHRLRGMFACAIWDRRARALTLARDRLGIKPLYYAETDAGLVFASELKAMLAHPSVRRDLDLAALSHYLSFGTTPATRSAVAGVKKLAPGHTLRVEAGRVVRLQRYWDLRPKADASGHGAGAPGDGNFGRGDDRSDGRSTLSDGSGDPWAAFSSLPEKKRSGRLGEAALVEALRELLHEAVASHLVSDVPVGAFLSGGVDSASVVAIMARIGRRPRTFSIGWDEPDFDELRYARKVADLYGAEHEELVVRPEVWGLLDEIVPFLDEPFADVSAIPTYLVSKLAAQSVKVVLSGDGGDEVFGGYDHYLSGLREARRYDRLPGAVRSLIGRGAAALPDAAPGKRWLRHASLAPRLRFLDGESLFPDDLKARLCTPDLRAAIDASRGAGNSGSDGGSDGAGDEAGLDPVGERAALLEGAPGDRLSRLLYLDTMTYLPLDILTKVDRMSMAHSLEVRPPLLDTPLVEAMARLPSSWKLRGGERKVLLKKAMKGWVPDEILRRPKRGFGVPIRSWFRGPLRAAALEVLFDPRTLARGLFDARYVRALVDEHQSGRRDQSLRLWSLLVLELWTRQALEGEAHPLRAREARRA